MEKVTEATLHLEKVTEAMAKFSLSLECLKVTEAMAKCNLSLNYSQKNFWPDWTTVQWTTRHKGFLKRTCNTNSSFSVTVQWTTIHKGFY